MILWENIKIFYLVAKYNSFKTVANILNINLSTITRRIQNLEKIIEKELFINKNPIILSPLGERLKDYVENSCLELLKLNKDVIHQLMPKEKLQFYVNDLYFFNLIEQIYDCHSIKSMVDIQNVSIVDSNFIEILINKEETNFIYISSDNNLINNMTKNYNYVAWPIYNIPICWYEKKNDNSHFISYTGMENWLLEIHQKYIKKNNIDPSRIVESNSIDIIFQLIQCSGSTILPQMININTKEKELKMKLLTERNLFFLCHVSDVFLKLIF